MDEFVSFSLHVRNIFSMLIVFGCLFIYHAYSIYKLDNKIKELQKEINKLKEN